MALSAAQVKATTNYIKNHTRRFTIQCHNEKDADVITYLESCGNVNALVKRLIREEIKRESADN